MDEAASVTCALEAGPVQSAALTVLKVIYNVADVVRYLLVGHTSHVTNVPTLFETYNSSCTLQQNTQLGVMAFDGSFSSVNNS